jgi:NAD-specific glutamate dehydrogenase
MSFWQRIIKTNAGGPEQAGTKTLQIRSATRNGSHIFITLADDEGFFIYDAIKMTITEIYRGPKGRIGSVLTLTEPWPPVF